MLGMELRSVLAALFLVLVPKTVTQILFHIGALPMSVLPAIPQFGGRLMTPAYYQAVASIIGVLRPASTLRTIAHHLNGAGFTTPTGLAWTRDRLANYLRSTSI